MNAHWPYYIILQNGKLYIRTPRQGLQLAFFHSNPPLFKDAVEAEAWLEAQDIRGNVQ